MLLATILLQITPPSAPKIPLIDLAFEAERQIVVDREAGQYLGHPTTCLLDDGQTVLCVYPKGHGKGGIVFKRFITSTFFSGRAHFPDQIDQQHGQQGKASHPSKGA